MAEIHARTCHLCEANCGVVMIVEDGKVTSVKGNPDHVLSEGYICPKATAIPDLQNDPDRLRHPVKKVGEDWDCLLYTSPSPRDATLSRMPSSA